MRAGGGDSTWYMILHILFEHLVRQLCSALPALHSLTRCDITSKVGTMKEALKAEPEKFLKSLSRSPVMSQSVNRNAEH